MDAPPYANGRFSWVDLSAHDLQAALPFYEAIFGWESGDANVPDGHRYVMFHLGGVPVAGGGELSAPMQEQGVPPTWNSYIGVDDIEETVQKALDAGASVVAPIMQAADAGRMAFISDPEGAVFGLWEAGEHQGAGAMRVHGTCTWNELNTRDPDAAQAFYGRVFDWSFAPMEGNPSNYWTVRASDSTDEGDFNGGLLEMTEEWGDMPAHWMVYFAVDDVAAAVERIRAGGGTIHHGPFDTQVGPMAVVSDPQGAVFMVMKSPS